MHQPIKLNRRLRDKETRKLGIFADFKQAPVTLLGLLLLLVLSLQSPLLSSPTRKMGQILLISPVLSFEILSTSILLAFSSQSDYSHFGFTSPAPALGAPSSNWGLSPHRTHFPNFPPQLASLALSYGSELRSMQARVCHVHLPPILCRLTIYICWMSEGSK